MYLAGYVAVHCTAVASGSASARVDMPVCTMTTCALPSLRGKPECTRAGKELKCGKDAGRVAYGTRAVRFAGKLTIPQAARSQRSCQGIRAASASVPSEHEFEAALLWLHKRGFQG